MEETNRPPPPSPLLRFLGGPFQSEVRWNLSQFSKRPSLGPACMHTSTHRHSHTWIFFPERFPPAKIHHVQHSKLWLGRIFALGKKKQRQLYFVLSQSAHNNQVDAFSPATMGLYGKPLVSRATWIGKELGREGRGAGGGAGGPCGFTSGAVNVSRQAGSFNPLVPDALSIVSVETS